MRILYAYRYGIVGGVSTQLLLRKRALERLGHDCTLFFSQDNGLMQVLPPNEINIHFGGFSTFRKIVNQRYDAIMIVDTPELLRMATSHFVRRSKVFLDIHTTTEIGLSYLKDLSFKKITGVMVPSVSSKVMVKRICPDSIHNLFVIPNLLNSDVFFPQKLGLNINLPAIPHFIWVGKFDRHKNWRLALIYAKLLKDLLGDIRLYMVGGFTARDEIAQSFFDLIYRLGLTGSVTWLERLENVRLAELYRQCANSGGAMIVTSRNESFGMAAAEALMCGCPLISNNLPVFNEIFPESPMLQLIDIWDPEQFVSAIDMLMANNITEKEQYAMYENLSTRYGEESFSISLQRMLVNASN